jgi:radical SAM-linked protein
MVMVVWRSCATVYTGPEKTLRIRVRFDKCDVIRFSSHKDVLRVFQRGFAAAGIPVAYSQGFHPHMRMSFGPPLKTGWEGLDEYMDVHLEEPVEEFEQKCNQFLPDGLRVRGSGLLADGTPKLANDICTATYTVCFSGNELAKNNLDYSQALTRTDNLQKSFAAETENPNGKLPELTGAAIKNTGSSICIEYTSTMLSGRVVSPVDVVAAIAGDPEFFETPIQVTRTRQYVCRGGEYMSPLSRTVIQGQL